MRNPTPNRRTFLMHGAAAVAATGAALDLASVAHAAGSDRLKIGLVGCGGRGTGAAEQALTADKNIALVAMADAFEDRMAESLSALQGSAVARQVEVSKETQFVGFDAYKQVIDNVDVVLLATPPGFRPIHFAYAIEKGKHTFVEKPIAVDATGVRSFLESVEVARAKGLSLVAGLCWRYHVPRKETMSRVRDGAIGKVVAIETTYDSGGVWEPRKTRAEVKSEMEYQMRNWYYYDWLSGDHIVEQAIHAIDTMAWAMGDEPPARCFASGGRTVRTGEEYGNIYDHFSVVYEYANGARGYHNSRHWRGAFQQVKDYILGAKGTCDVFGSRISGETTWRFRPPAGAKYEMYQAEHDALFASIRAGKPINDGVYVARSTLLAIMGREAAYTGESITWEKALDSKQSLVPSKFAWGEAPVRPVPRPGATKFV
jgi:predicted dehydrogenase